MKSIVLSIVLASLFLLPSITSIAQNLNKDTTVVFKVSGECEMCKKRIETAAQGKGVSAAKWNISTKNLSLTYNPTKTRLQKVHDRIADVGHDTELKKAATSVYNALPECCLYRKAGPAATMEEH